MHKWQAMNKKTNSKNKIIGLWLVHQRANKQHRQTSKNIIKVDQEGTFEFRRNSKKRNK